MRRDEFLSGTAHYSAKRGNDLPHAKLNPEKVREIRRNRRGLTARQWAQELGLHVRTIEAVRAYKNWRHVHG